MSITAMRVSLRTHMLMVSAMIRCLKVATDCGRQGQPVKCCMIGLSGDVMSITAMRNSLSTHTLMVSAMIGCRKSGN